jgi:hypothetical protein
LQLIQRAEELLSESHFVELVPDRLVEALANPIRLRPPGSGPTVVDVLDGQIKLIFVGLDGAAESGASIGEDAQRAHILVIEPGDDPIIQQIGRRERCAGRVQFGEGDLASSVDECLVVEATDALDGADILGILGSQGTRMIGLDLAFGFALLIGSLHRLQQGLGQDQILLSGFFF